MVNVTAAKLTEELAKQRELLLADFEERHRQIVTEIVNKFDEQTKSLQSSLQLAIDEGSEAEKMTAVSLEKVERLESTVGVLVETNKLQASQIHKLTNQLEERTNRQLRSTLVFKGIPEPPHEKFWEDTKTVLTEAVVNTVPNLNVQRARELFERVHRSGYTGKDGCKKGRRDIFVKMYDWNHGEQLNEDFRAARLSDREMKFSCEQKYGPLTTAKRNFALSERFKLKRDGVIVAGYVAYPAKLLVKKTHLRTETYSVYRDFSKFNVHFDTEGVNVTLPVAEVVGSVLSG